MSVNVTPERTAQSLSLRVAEEIRVAMLRRRITGARLAKELGVSAAWVSYRLTGSQPIDLNDLQRIADVLDVEVVDLLPSDRRVPKLSKKFNPGQRVIAKIGQPRAARPAGRAPMHSHRPGVAVAQTRPRVAALRRPFTPSGR